MADRKHLRLCGLQWHVIVAVPRSLQDIIGQTQLKRSLKTDSLTGAQDLRWTVVREFKRKIAGAKRLAKGTPGDALTQEAIRFNEEIKRDEARVESGELDPEMQVSAGELLDDLVSEVIAPKHGKAAARKYHAIASGKATPIMVHIEQWLGELTVNDDTKDDHRLALRELSEWGESQGHATLQGITQKVAGEFAAYLLTEGNRKARGQPMSRRTVAKRRSSLAAYWDWLTERDHLPEESANPWRRLRSLAPKKSDAKLSRKRKFTDVEMRHLLYTGEPDAALKDYMFIGALSGMRIDEIARLKVADCKGGVFNVVDAKTSSGIRAVPIHSALRKLVARRSKDKTSGEWLIEDVDLGGGGHKTKRTGKRGDRSMPVSKRFGRFRQSVGVHDQREDERQSAVDFHSFRRWFTQQAKDAGIPEHVTAAVVGHKYDKLTYGLYAKDELMAKLRECVESALLPSRPRTSR
ncbi:DUF6538 domain-containing protein [Hyphomicrobium sp.]|uniref:DUF6538 domain-containing protein n=1 Tax=Hyphomicrobium sp. TaxID=82 RepID=UPI0035635C8A